MGKLSLCLVALGVAACGSDNNNPADAKVVIVPDAKMIDAPKVFNDAPPVNYNFSCYNQPAPTTAADPVTISGTTETFSTTLDTLPGVTVQSYKAGVATMLDTQTSGAAGAFTTGSLATGGVPLDGYLRASIAGYRTTYLYPPNKVVANLTMVPVPLISNATFTQLNALVNQNDTNNGMLLVTVADCSLMPISGADLTAKQNGNNAGTITDLGAVLGAMADGLYIVANVPDGDVTVAATYNSMNFPGRVVAAHKKPADANAEGTLTVTAVVPGPF
ncbi:MAG: hypothetical protein ABI678_00265 [Kofleriaceae bacterium]